jgi:translation initiation factor IF-2
MGAGRRARVRVLLRSAVPVPAGELAALTGGGGGRRLHAGAPRGPGAFRRAGPDQRRPHRRRGPGPDDQAPARALLARAVDRGGQRAPVPPAGRPVADGGPVGLPPAPVFALAAGRDRGRAGVHLPAAAGRGDRRAGGRSGDGRGGDGRGGQRPGRASGGHGPGRLGPDVTDLRAHAPAVPAIAAAGSRLAADRAAVHRDDRRFRPAALRRPGRGVEGADGPGPVTLAV